MKLKCQMPLSAVIHNVQLGKLCLNSQNKLHTGYQGWRMVKSETRRDAEILVRNPSPRLFGEKFRDSKKVKTNHEKTRLRDLSKTLPRFRDPAKIFRDPRFPRYHSAPLLLAKVLVENFLGLHCTYSFTLDKQICKQRSGRSDLLRVTVKPSQGRTPQDSISELII